MTRPTLKTATKDEHVATELCNFDRESSLSEDRYVCGCGWVEPRRSKAVERKLRYSRKMLYTRTRKMRRA